jgi:hypothetical protein
MPQLFKLTTDQVIQPVVGATGVHAWLRRIDVSGLFHFAQKKCSTQFFYQNLFSYSGLTYNKL